MNGSQTPEGAITCARQWARRLVPSSLSAVLICSAMPSCSTNRCTSVRLPKAASSFVGTCWGEGDQHAISGNQHAISLQSVVISLPSEAISMQSTREAPFGWGVGSQSACNRLGRHLLGGGSDRKRRWRVRQRDGQMVLEARGTWSDLTKHAVGGTECLVAACCAEPLHARLREL